MDSASQALQLICMRMARPIDPCKPFCFAKMFSQNYGEFPNHILQTSHSYFSGVTTLFSAQGPVLQQLLTPT